MENKYSLKGKIIVITGGTGILGNAFIKGVLEAGGTACILGRNSQVAAERAQEACRQGYEAMSLTADVLNQAQLTVACEQVLAKYGRIDGLVNAAGGNMPEGTLQNSDDIFKMNLSGMRTVMDLNIWGTLLPTQVFGEAIAASGSGSIINISSMNSKRAVTKVLGYNMGKAAIDCYNQWFAVEMANRYGDKIRMNALAPGFFLTEQNKSLLTSPDGDYSARGKSIIRQTPFNRFGHPDELIGALVWLLSDASSFVTGSMVCVDGGFSIYSGV